MNIINIKVLQNNLSSVQFSCSVVSDSATPWTLKSSSFSVLFFAFSYCSWGSQSKNTEVVCHSLLQWTTFCQNSPLWPIHLEWPHTSRLSFIELDQAVVHLIRLASFLWLWFQCVCPLMPSLRAYCLTWVSLTLDVGYLLSATTPDLGCGVSPLGGSLLATLYLRFY